jgi:hypothetical protein
MEKIVKTQNEASSARARDKQVFLTNFHGNIFSKVHLCIFLQCAILLIIPFAKRKFTCVFVLRALSGPACAMLQPKL